MSIYREEELFITKDISLVNFLIKRDNKLIRIGGADENNRRKFKFKNTLKVLSDFRFYYCNRDAILERKRVDITSADIIIAKSVAELMVYLKNGYQLIGTEVHRYMENKIVFRVVKDLS